MDAPHEDVGARLRAMREAAGHSQTSMARELGISRQTVWAIEAGQSGSHLETLKRWTDVCGQPLAAAFVDPAEDLGALVGALDAQGRQAVQLLATQWGRLDPAFRSSIVAMLQASAASARG